MNRSGCFGVVSSDWGKTRGFAVEMEPCREVLMFDSH